MTSLLLIWVTSSTVAVGYDWLCAPEQFVEALRCRHFAEAFSLLCAVLIFVIGGPVALVATIIYHGKWR